MRRLVVVASERHLNRRTQRHTPPCGRPKQEAFSNAAFLLPRFAWFHTQRCVKSMFLLQDQGRLIVSSSDQHCFILLYIVGNKMAVPCFAHYSSPAQNTWLRRHCGRGRNRFLAEQSFRPSSVENQRTGSKSDSSTEPTKESGRWKRPQCHIQLDYLTFNPYIPSSPAPCLCLSWRLRGSNSRDWTSILWSTWWAKCFFMWL